MRVLLTLILALAAADPRPRPSDGPPDLVEKAYSAAEEKRFCEAVPLFLALHERAPQPKHLYRAAEVAYAAGDLLWAQDLYRSVKESYPQFDKMRAVEARLGELQQRIARNESTAACPAPPTVCGDWLVRPGEQCDDGNLEDGDGCDGNCLISACGNGRRAGDEECDDGNLDDGDGCDGNCTLSRCGNGLRAGAEECDDGNLGDGDGCDSNCTETRCGNGVRTSDEACDDGNAANGDGCDRNCTLSVCGNGARDPGEQCDDGNLLDGDGCDRGCIATACGNGVRAGVEQCDDGNVLDGDSCTSDCRLPDAPRPPDPAPAAAGGATWAPVLTLAAGAGVTATSAVLLALGAAPLAQHAGAVQRIEDARARADAEPNAALEDAREAQRDARAAESSWQSFGAPLFFGGIVGVTAGVLALAAGGVWLVLDDEEAPPPDASEERLP